jgi:hypothetical protein
VGVGPSKKDLFSLQYFNGTIIPVPFTNESLYDSHFTGAYGAGFFASSGDNAQNVSWPAVSPNVVGVGGTTLAFNANGSVASETVWNDQWGRTGGGISEYETEPSYQVSYGVQGSNGRRSVPDVSYAADPINGSSSGFSVYVNGTWGSIYGTSAGAPQWAAIRSLGLWASNERFYAIASNPSYSSCFRDITVGTNGNYNATSSYDFCTGLGSPLTTVFNTAPNTPSTCSGSTSGYVCRSYYYSTSTTDPDGDNVMYEFSWGDGTDNTVIGPYPSGVNVDRPHGWFRPGTFNVSVRAQDSYNASSGWSSPLTVNVSQNDAESGGDAGDSLSTALSIETTLPPWTGTYLGTLYSSNPTDHNDWYKFYVRNGWSIGVSLTYVLAPLSNFDIELYNPSGTRVAYSNNPGTQVESILYDADSTGNWAIRVLWVSGEGQYDLTISLLTGGYDNCPVLFVWNGTNYVDYGVVKIHNPSGYDVIREVPIQAGDVNVSNYKAVFRLQESWPGLNYSESFIDQVKLYAVDSQGNRLLCPLIKAQHSRLGNVLPQLLFSDDWKVQTLLLDTIDLTFLVPYPTGQVQSYVFVLEGCNMIKQ